ncbi:MAG TPA: cytochrome c3 family protein [Edaphobacter sp.]|nr:cytochrome c3 family protein [Edaphobacter sp.]
MQKFLVVVALLLSYATCAPAQTSGTGSSSAAPEPTATAPAQPIPFNHKLHMQTAKMSCNDCHEPRGDGATVSLPQPPTCMKCHVSIATDKPEIKRLAEAAKNEDPILWVRVYHVPSFVTFSHKTHAGNKCEECHGPVAERTAIAQEKDTNMGSCIACHQAKGAPTTCNTCHSLMSSRNESPFMTSPSVLAWLHDMSDKRNQAKSSSGPKSSPVRTRSSVLAAFLNAPLL